MTGTDPTLECIDALDTQPTGMCLRCPDGEQQRHLMPAVKATLGAGAGCAVPIRYPGVGPLHCVLFPNGTGWRVRRWSSDTLLNGGVFTEAPIEIGDRLQLGPVEIEFVGDALPGNREPGHVVERDELSYTHDEEIASPRTADVDVSDYVPVVHAADATAEQSVIGERITEHRCRLDELERQLAECAAEGQQSQRELGELRRQLDDVRHELAHAEQLHAATREALIELERLIAEWRKAPIVAQPARPKGFGLSRRVWPIGLRRRLVAPGNTSPQPVDTSNAVGPTEVHPPGEDVAQTTEEEPASSGTECQSQLDNTQHGEAVSTEGSERTTTNEEVAESAAPPEKAFVEPESFLDKFQHLLTQGEQADEAATEVPQSSEANQPHPTLPEPAAADHSQSPNGEDEDSIENYMTRLLQRVRGETSSDPATDAPATETCGVASTNSHESNAVAGITPQMASQLLSNLEDIKAAPAPERSCNMAALRNLANQSAHSAIQSAELRQYRESGLLNLSLSLLGIVCGTVVVQMSSSYTSLAFIGGLGSLLAGLFWGGRTIVLLMQAIRDGSWSDANQATPPHEQVPPDISADDL